MVDVRRLRPGEEESTEIALTLDDLAREGARRMIAAALRAEADEYVARFEDELDEDGHRLVVRNGRARERKVTVGSGTVPVRAPRVNDKRVDVEAGERQRFSSKILPAYARRSPKVCEVLPILYLRGLSTGDFRPALEDLLGEDASGLSASTTSRLCKEWEAHHERFCKQHLGFSRYAYLFVDGVHVSVRLGEDDKLCLLVVIGVCEDGEKELLAVKDGYRESTDSWARVFRQAPRAWLSQAGGRRRRARRVGGAARCVPRGRRAALLGSQDRERARLPAQAAFSPRPRSCCTRSSKPRPARTRSSRLRPSAKEFGAKYPKALEKLDRDCKPLTAFYDFPAEHWRHLPTTNPIQSSFATVKLRTRVTKGAGSKAAALAMAYKLLITAQERWRRINGHELITDVLDRATFKDGVKVTDDEATTQDEEVAA